MSTIERDVTDELPQEVEGFLDWQQHQDPQDEEPPAPAVDLALALRLMRRLGRIRKSAAQHTAALRAERDLIDRAIGEIEAVAERRAAPIEDLLKLYHRNRLAEDSKAKTVSLAPWGDLRATEHKKPTVKLLDRDAACAWCDEHSPEFIKRKPDLDWAKLKGCLFVTPDGRVIVTKTGEVVEGVGVEEPHTDYSVKLAEVK